MISAPCSTDGEDRSFSRSRTLGPAILRIAGWPIETVDPLRSAELAARVDRWILDEEAIRRESDALARRLHEIIPQIGDKKTRAIALELKRHLHGTSQPLPKPLVAGLLGDERARETLACTVEAAVRRRHSHAAERDGLERAHAAELERARTELDRLTTDTRFLRALCIASPSTFRQWQAARHDRTNRRRYQRLQSTLHRYLMRAVGRATPNGLWAGISLESSTGDPALPLSIAPAAPVTRVSPALAVFAGALQSMNVRRPWIEAVPLRLNPTLRRVGDEVWELGTFVDGYWCLRRFAHHAAIEALAATVSLTDRPYLRDIADVLCRSDPDMASAAAGELAEILVQAGVLWSTALIPPIYTSPWQAFDGMIETLPPGEKPIWQRCRENLARISKEIETGVDDIEPAALRSLLDDARGAADTVFARYEASVPPGQDVLVLDRSAPFRFSLSDALAKTIERSIRNYWSFDRFGLGEIETTVARQQRFGIARDRGGTRLHDFLAGEAEDSPGGMQSWEDRVLSKAAGEYADRARAAFARWEQELEPAFAAEVHRLGSGNQPWTAAVLPPGSALLLLGACGRELVLRLGGVTPEPCFFYSRFSYLFCADASRPDPFLAWHKAGTDEIERRWPQLRFVDLAIRNHRNPNVTARPRTASEFVDALDDEGRTLREATITLNANGVPTLSLARTDQLLIPWARSAAYLAGLDRFASVLASVSMFLGRPALLAPMPRLSREIAAWRHLPRLVLDDTTISPERWTPHDELGQSLAKAHGAERFILWRRFVRAARLPDFVFAFHGRETESMVATTGALAIEFLGQALKAHGPSLRIQEVFPRPEQFVARDEDGKRYLAELAVAWQGDAEFWQAYVEGGSPAERGR